jgi:hypothetical protein
MISDVLHDALLKIDSALFVDDAQERVYKGELRERILAVCMEMHNLRKELDRPPTPGELISDYEGTIARMSPKQREALKLEEDAALAESAERIERAKRKSK